MPQCFVSEYDLSENNIWTVGDCTMMIGIFVILSLMVIGAGVGLYYINRWKTRAVGVAWFWVTYRRTPLSVFEGFDRTHKAGIMQHSLDLLDDAPKNGLPQVYDSLAGHWEALLNINYERETAGLALVTITDYYTHLEAKGLPTSTDETDRMSDLQGLSGT
jgi:hypothetical protein